MNKSFDSIIFDMDGTLWDAVDSYCSVWNVTLSQSGVSSVVVTREDLLGCMGLTIDVIFDRILGHTDIDRDSFLVMLKKNELEMMPRLGGVLYDGVRDGLSRLKGRYRLFMVSNCGSDGLKNFLSFTDLSSLIEDTLTNGETGLDKASNLKLLVEKNGLENPLYVGDIQRDSDAAHHAGMPFVWAAYGFGQCDDYDFKVNDFAELVKLLS